MSRSPKRCRSLVVVGDSLLDRDVVGTVDRLSPDAPVAVLDERSRGLRPGGAALAAALAVLDGADVTLVTALADDEAADELRGALEALGVEVMAAPLAGATPEKIRLRTDNQALLRLDRGCGGAAKIGPFPTAALDIVAEAGVVVMSDYGRGVSADRSLREALAARRRPAIWDPHPRGATPVPQLTLITPNLSELDRAVPGGTPDMASVAARTEVARRGWDAQAVATTLGARGALLVTGDGAPLAVQDDPVTSGDPCGAGDRFVTAVATALLGGALLTEAVTDAVGVAGRFVAAGGAGASGATSRGAEERAPAAGA
ncbi:MAG: PfkB family carbohydrate kinase, partial [Acidimicrobiales bacterium]